MPDTPCIKISTVVWSEAGIKVPASINTCCFAWFDVSGTIVDGLVSTLLNSCHGDSTMYAKTTTTLLTALLLVASASAQTEEYYDTLQSSEFKQQQLRVDLPGLQIASSTGEVIDVSCANCWDPYQGYERLSEAVFFERAGQAELAQRAKRSRKKKFITLGIGGVSLIGGGALMAHSVSQNQNQPGSSVGEAMIGSLLLGAGSFMVGYTVMTLNRRSVSYNLAREIALDYNDQLLDATQTAPR